MQVHNCIKNNEPDNTNDHVLRLNNEAHPLEYANDDDANSIWVSDFMNDVNLVVDLGDEFQVSALLAHSGVYWSHQMVLRSVGEKFFS